MPYSFIGTGNSGQAFGESILRNMHNMFCALIHYLSIDTVNINQLRRKYDPQVDLIAPHITIVFPMRESIGEQRLVSHIEKVLLEWKPFPIHLKGLYRSWDN